MRAMFYRATSFNQDIENSVSTNVLLTTFNQDIGNWNVSNVSSMGQVNQDIGNWDVMNRMFKDQAVCNQHN